MMMSLYQILGDVTVLLVPLLGYKLHSFFEVWLEREVEEI